MNVALSYQPQLIPPLTIMLPGTESEQRGSEAKLEKLEEKREAQSKKLLVQMQNKTHKLYNILPAGKSHRYETSHANTLTVPALHTERFAGDFVINALLNYQKTKN